MSVNYHAFQSRGVLFSEYEVVSEQWRTAFTGYDPTRIAGILHFTADEQYLWLKYFQIPYRLCLADGHLGKNVDGTWTEELYFNESMAIYHLLQYTVDHPAAAGEWVPNYAIDGMVARNPAVADPLLTSFGKAWSGKAGTLAELCVKSGGKKIAKGDAGFEFEVFPFLHLQLVFWDADEDFPAQIQIFADKNVTDFVHYETVGCIISDLLERLTVAES